MLILRRLLTYAAQRVATDPRVQAKAGEVYENTVRPRAKAAAGKARANLDFARAELSDLAAETDPLTNPLEFAAKAKRRLFDPD
ncbi:MAG: hypothetical protein QF926_13150 [Alphaproteobacteria bacterium]|jgi:hypothetical protein|nr:hypothetical protein [Alphaproteobacteria bacterium]